MKSVRWHELGVSLRKYNDIAATDIFNKKRNCCNHPCPGSVYFNMMLIIIYLSATKTFICCRKMSLLPSVLHKIQYMIFKIPYWTHRGIVFDKCHKNASLIGTDKILHEWYLMLPLPSSTSWCFYNTVNKAFQHSCQVLALGFLMELEWRKQ